MLTQLLTPFLPYHLFSLDQQWFFGRSHERKARGAGRGHDRIVGPAVSSLVHRSRRKGFSGDADLLSGWSFIGAPINALAKIDLSILGVELVAIALVVSVIIYLLRAKH